MERKRVDMFKVTANQASYIVYSGQTFLVCGSAVKNCSASQETGV